MKRFVVRLLINALALWLTTLLVAGVKVVPFTPMGADPGTEGGTLEAVLTYLLVALIFGIVNGVIGNFIRVVAFPIYVLTLGLIALVVNGLLLLLVAWISDLIGFGLEVEGFWWGVLGALVLALFSWIIGIVLRPFVGRD
ncbi:phage holin family protein [Lysobacter korlensis]|uniref:Phage holin family protein n=1 Tax=Lysobacter korlensis TaxID=553636 RepID=A0ABV6RWV1_9GAMM